MDGMTPAPTTTKSTATVDATLLMKARYLERAERLRAVVSATLSPREVAAFVLCTPQQPYERAVEQWRYWMATGDLKGSFWKLRKGYIDKLPPDATLTSRSGERGEEWAQRIAEGVEGLGAAKAAFLTCLLEPLRPDVLTCLDVHMWRHLTGLDDFGTGLTAGTDERSFRRALNFPPERLLQRKAQAEGWLPFPWQWAKWDEIRGRETDIAEDLTT